MLRTFVGAFFLAGCSHVTTTGAPDDGGLLPDGTSGDDAASDGAKSDAGDASEVGDSPSADVLADGEVVDGSVADVGPVTPDPDTVVVSAITQAAGIAATTTTSLADRAAKIKELLSAVPGVGAVTQDANFDLEVTLPSGQIAIVVGNRLATGEPATSPFKKPKARVYDLPTEKTAVLFVMDGATGAERGLQADLHKWLAASDVGYTPIDGKGTVEEIIANFGAGSKVGLVFWASHGTANRVWTGTPYTDALDRPVRSDRKEDLGEVAGSQSEKRLKAMMADGVSVRDGLTIGPAELTDPVTGKTYYQAGYLATAAWFSKHLHLAPSAFVYMNQCLTMADSKLSDAFHGVGAETYIGFDKLAWTSFYLTDGPRRIFQGLLGLDTFEPPSPKMRPFDVQAVFDWQKSAGNLVTRGRSVPTDPIENNDPVLRRWALNEMLAPSIEKVIVGTGGGTITLSNTKRATTDRGKVFYGTTQLTTCGPASADIYDVSLVCSVPDAVRATAGDVYIDYKGTKSNKVKMTQWTGHVHFEEHGPLTYSAVFDADIAFAADVHSFRTEAYGSVTANNNYGFCSAAQCKGTYAFGGGPSGCVSSGSGPMTVTSTAGTANQLWASAFIDPAAATQVKLTLDAFGTLTDCGGPRQGEASWNFFADGGARNTFVLAMDDTFAIADKTYPPITRGTVTYTLALTGFKVNNPPEGDKDFE